MFKCFYIYNTLYIYFVCSKVWFYNKEHIILHGLYNMKKYKTLFNILLSTLIPRVGDNTVLNHTHLYYRNHQKNIFAAILLMDITKSVHQQCKGGKSLCTNEQQ